MKVIDKLYYSITKEACQWCGGYSNDQHISNHRTCLKTCEGHRVQKRWGVSPVHSRNTALHSLLCQASSSYAG